MACFNPLSTTRRRLKDNQKLQVIVSLLDAIENNDLDELEDQAELTEAEQLQKRRILHKILSQLDVTYITKKGFWHEGV